jgi:hypothetical protein
VSRRVVLIGVLLVGACVIPDTAPDEPAAIEFAPFPWPSVVLGDVMRNERGDSVPVRAIVRNVSGGELTDVPIRFLVPDSLSRFRVRVDSVRGYVRGDSLTSQPIRLIARASDELQAITPGQGRGDGGIFVTLRPDSLGRSGTRQADTVLAAVTDTIATNIGVNISQDLTVALNNRVESVRTPVQRWIVRFRVVSPANPSNDTTATYFMVERESASRRPSDNDTTDQSGLAGRALRVRGSRVRALPETVVVEAVATYRGQLVAGSPVRFPVLIRRP